MKLQWVITVECDDRYDELENLVDDLESMFDLGLGDVFDTTDDDGNEIEVPVRSWIEFAP